MRRRLRQYLFFNYFILGLGPLLFVAIFLGWQSIQRQQQQVLQLEEAEAERLASELRHYFEDIERELQILTRVWNLNTLSDAELQIALAQLPVINRAIEAAYLHDSDGRLLAQTEPVGISEQPDTAALITEDVFTIPLSTGALYYSAMRLGQISREPYMTLSLPLRDVRSNEITGVLITTIRLAPVWQVIADTDLREGESIFVVDSWQRVIAHQDPAIVLSDTRYTPPDQDGVNVGLSGDEVVMAMAPVALGMQTLTLVIERSLSSALAPAYQELQTIGILMFMVLLLAIIVTVSAGRQIVRPLETLVAATQAVSAGDLTHRAVVANVDEIGDLATSFNQMTARLQQTLAGLERQVGALQVAQLALSESEKRYRDIVENANDIIYAHDLAGQLTDFNEAAERLLGYRREDAPKYNMSDLVVPEHLTLAREMTARNLLEGGSLTYELIVSAADGRQVPLEVNTRILYEQGQPVGVQGMARDISERKEAEAALRLSEEMNRTLLAAIPDHLIRLSSAGAILDVRGADDFSGVPVTSVLGLTIDDIIAVTGAEFHPILRRVADLVARVRESGANEVFEFQLPGREDERHFELRVRPGQDGEVLCIVRDISEPKRAQQAVNRSQKLESIGVLAGGIAHDFNNLLTGILAQTSLAATQLPARSPAQDHIKKAVRSAERARDLTRQLLAYAGKGQFTNAVLDLNKIIHENLSLLQTVLTKGVELSLDLQPNLSLIEADPGQVQQVVMNLVLNGAEAIEAEVGVVHVTTEEKTIWTAAAGYLGSPDLSPGRYVCLSVSDNGAGMDGATMDRIFDPFFSTKESGRGLGLSATLGIIRAHKGGLKVTSEPGLGTTFQVLFPVTTAAVAAETMLTPPPGLVTYTPATVLVIDDEASVREAVSDILSLAGIDSLTAVNGREGVALYQEYRAEIRLVLVDMQMPVMNGAETYRALRAINPELKVILSSGYSEFDVTHQIELSAFTTFLQKPYDMNTLLQTVQAEMHEGD